MLGQNDVRSLQYGLALFALFAVDMGSAYPSEREEIVVTARKREESLLSIPVAVQALELEGLRERGVTSLQELSGFAPGLDLRNSGGETWGSGRWISGVRFRGLRAIGLNPSFQTGAVFVDGVYCLNCAQSLSFEAISRVEIIRGPQAAYFGRSTFGGAVNLVTATPSDAFGAGITAEYSDVGDYLVSGTVEGPIIGGVLTGRLVAASRQKGAQWTATDGGQLGEERTDEFTVQLSWRPTDRWDLSFRSTYQRDQDGPPSTTQFSFNKQGNAPVGSPVEFRDTNGNTVSGTLTTPWHFGTIPFGQRITSNTAFPEEPWPAAVPINWPADEPLAGAPLQPRDVLVENIFGFPDFDSYPSLDRFGINRNTQRYALLGSYEINDAWSVLGNLAYNRQNGYRIYDIDYSNTHTLIYGAPLRFKNYSGELRVSYDGGSALRGLIGVNYYDQSTRGSFDNGISPGYELDIGLDIPARQYPLVNDSDNDDISTLGFFGSLDYDILANLTLSLEGRYQIDKVARYGGSFADGLFRLPEKVESKKFLPRAILSYMPVDDLMVYGSFARGTLPGDINDVIANLVPEDIEAAEFLLGELLEQVSAEVLDSYEIGIKQSAFDGRLNYALTLYYMEWKNQKSQATVFLPVRRTTSFLVTGDSTFKGIEFEGSLQAADNLLIEATADIKESTFDDFKLPGNALLLNQTTTVGFNAVGNTLPLVPQESFSVSATWSDTLTGDWTYSIRGDFLYTGKTYTDELNLNWIPSYDTTNLRIRFTNDDVSSGLSFEIFVLNLFDEEAWVVGAAGVDLSDRPIPLPVVTVEDQTSVIVRRGAYMTPLDGRRIGARLQYKF